MDFTEQQIAESLGPDAWAWAAKKGYVADERVITDIIQHWVHEGMNPKLAERLGGMLLTIAGAYLRDYDET